MNAVDARITGVRAVSIPVGDQGAALEFYRHTLLDLDGTTSSMTEQPSTA